MKVRVRFAPSPTGYLHIGGARSALFTWMFARRHGGDFLLRIEDTDVKRTQRGAIENILDSLHWLGLDWDEGPDINGPHAPYIQTQRAPLYQQWANWLLDNGYAYRCFCTPEELEERRRQRKEKGSSSQGYDRTCRWLAREEIEARLADGKAFTIRFRMPEEGHTVVHDLIRGDIVVDNRQIPDYVLLKSNGLPTYHLAHPVDDHFMEITHITRAAEWLATAPLHVSIYSAFGWELPVYVHLPVILNPTGKGKLSKRKQVIGGDGAEVLVKVEEFREAGYLPQALVNFLANIGWSFGDDREKFTMEEAIARFDLADINPSETRLPYEKLDWLNGQYVQEMSAAELAEALKPFLEAAGYVVDTQALEYVAGTLSVRLKRLTDAVPLLRFLYIDDPVELTAEDLTDRKLNGAAARQAFGEARDFVAAVTPYDLPSIGKGLTAIGEKYSSNGKAGPFLGRLRYAITGQKVSPPIFESMLAMGRKRVLKKLDQALGLL